MKKIIRLAKNSGFCFGVKRAIQIALEQSQREHEIVTLGPIIHNSQMVRKLEENNVFAVETFEEIKDRKAIIRSHGIEKSEKEELIKKGIELIDTTCPYVFRTQEFGKKLEEEGYKVLILGDYNHPEVKAVKSYLKTEPIVALTIEELPKLNYKKIGIICQTTQRIEALQNLVDYILPRVKEVKIHNTICSATTIRQNSTRDLAKSSDIMIVIGGKNSSNTKQLAKISKMYAETHHIEVAEELEAKWFENKKKIGLTAGASTPDWCILDVYNKIINYIGDNIELANNVESIPGYYKEEQ